MDKVLNKIIEKLSTERIFKGGDHVLTVGKLLEIFSEAKKETDEEKLVTTYRTLDDSIFEGDDCC
jgi:hypothetical protein